MQNVQERTDIRQGLKQPYFDPGHQVAMGLCFPSAEIWNGRLAMIGFLFCHLD